MWRSYTRVVLYSNKYGMYVCSGHLSFIDWHTVRNQRRRRRTVVALSYEKRIGTVLLYIFLVAKLYYMQHKMTDYL